MTQDPRQTAYAAKRAALRGEPPSKVRLCAMAPTPPRPLVLIRGTFPDGSTKEARFPELLDAAAAWPEAIAVQIVRQPAEGMMGEFS